MAREDLANAERVGDEQHPRAYLHTEFLPENTKYRMQRIKQMFQDKDTGRIAAGTSLGIVYDGEVVGVAGREKPDEFMAILEDMRKNVRHSEFDLNRYSEWYAEEGRGLLAERLFGYADADTMELVDEDFHPAIISIEMVSAETENLKAELPLLRRRVDALVERQEKMSAFEEACEPYRSEFLRRDEAIRNFVPAKPVNAKSSPQDIFMQKMHDLIGTRENGLDDAFVVEATKALFEARFPKNQIVACIDKFAPASAFNPAIQQFKEVKYADILVAEVEKDLKAQKQKTAGAAR